MSNERLEMFGFPDPDEVGQTEYRVIHECLSDALASQDDDDPDESPSQMMLSILGEFRTWAEELITLIHQYDINHSLLEEIDANN
jgi:hypothetical protein